MTLDTVLAASSWMPGTTAVATNRAAAVISTWITTFMRISCHDARDGRYWPDAPEADAGGALTCWPGRRHVSGHSPGPRETIRPGVNRQEYIRVAAARRGKPPIRGAGKWDSPGSRQMSQVPGCRIP